MPLVAELHLDPKSLNAMAPQERFARVTKELDKQKAAFAAYQNTWDGLSSTLKDNVLRFLGDSTLALFEKMKGALEVINNWFSTHANRVGALLAAGFQKAFDVVAEHAPKLEGLANRGLNYLEGGGINKETATDVAAMGASRMVMLGLLESGLMSLGPAGMVAIAVFEGIEGAVRILSDTTSEWHTAAVGMWNSIKENFGEGMQSLKRAMFDLGDAMKPFADFLGGVLLGALTAITWAFKELAAAIEVAAGVVDWMVRKLGSMDSNSKIVGGGRFQDMQEWLDAHRTAIVTGARIVEQPGGPLKRGEPPPPPVQHITNHNTININGTGDPERVARLTVEELNKISRSPKTIGRDFTWRNKPITW
jgi:hypothetical protein